jgi:isoquinoline 1-oxidoreductase beta subunit
MIAFTVNIENVSAPEDHAERPLLWFLRDRLGLKGAKFGCGHGGCGACTVQIDGQAAPSCVTFLKDTAGKTVTTIEGLAAQPDNPVIRAWLAEQVPQCGYCQPGMIMTAAGLLAHAVDPSDREIDIAFAHMLCRCGTYQRARRAIHRAADQHWNDAPFPAAILTKPLPIPPREFVFNPWIKIAPDGIVTVVLARSEMGQGVSTALPMLVAEELMVPLDRIRTEFAPADHIYDNPALGRQVTVGSLSVKTSWLPLRLAGAQVREQLVQAAARRWNVPPQDCTAQEGQVIHPPTGRSLGYGSLATDAAQLTAPAEPHLKSPGEFRLLGKPTARLDLPDHVAGRTIFGVDVSLPGMLAASIVMPPVFGAKIARIDDTAALAMSGMRQVLAISDGVAVIADDHVAAMQAHDSLKVEWRGGAGAVSSATIAERFRAALSQPGEILRDDGNALHAIAAASSLAAAEFDTPYLAHAAIEPMNCTARIENGRCDVWVPTQGQGMAQEAAARAAGLPLEAVAVHTTFLGGGFGRRSASDVVTQTVEITKAIGKPVQLLWTRGEDMHHDRYRPASLSRLEAGLAADGHPTSWFQRVVGPTLAGEGIDMPYDIKNVRIEHVVDDPGVPTGYWRSVGSSQNAFAIECFIDELAHRAGRDPVEFRLSLLHASPRHRGVLALAAEKAGWTGRVSGGRSRGAAVYYAHGGWAAQIADISIDAGGAIRVHRVVCAVDCGRIINPDTVVAQIEGGIAFGMTAALKAAITIDHGRAQQTGFHDYPLLTMAEMPEVEVHIVKSGEDPSGVGECGVPPVAPAIANAVYAATGCRVRHLPIRPADIAANAQNRALT